MGGEDGSGAEEEIGCVERCGSRIGMCMLVGILLMVDCQWVGSRRSMRSRRQEEVGEREEGRRGEEEEGKKSGEGSKGKKESKRKDVQEAKPARLAVARVRH